MSQRILKDWFVAQLLVKATIPRLTTGGLGGVVLHLWQLSYNLTYIYRILNSKMDRNCLAIFM